MAVEERHNKKLGAKGEKLACRYLKKSGYKILERDYECPCGEVDVIARKDGAFVFIEVKTRLTDGFGAPSEAVDLSRQKRYIRSAEYYFYGRQIEATVRFDVIEVFRGRINHIENAFYC